MKCLLAIAGLLLVGKSRAILTDECNAFVDCLERAQERSDECSEILEESDIEEMDQIAAEAMSDKQACMKQVKTNITIKADLQREKDAAFKDCLDRRFQDSRPVELGRRKREQCDEKLLEYETRLDRVKRNARRAARRQRNRALKEAGRWEEWRALKGKKKEFRQCQRDARRLTKTCKPLAKCCSEASACHLEYELSDTHDGIKRTQLNILEGRRACSGLADDLDVVSADQIVDNQI